MNKIYAYTNGFASSLNLNLALAAYLHAEFSNLLEFHVCQVSGAYYQLFVISDDFISQKLLFQLQFRMNYFYFNYNPDAPFNLKNR